MQKGRHRFWCRPHCDLPAPFWSSGAWYPSQNSAYTTASFHLVQGTYASNDIKFYIVPAYLKEANGSRTVLEGTISAETSIADPYASGKGMVITKQPEVYWMKNDDQSETAFFEIEAVKDDEFLSTEDVNFYWQEYNEEEDTWDTVQSDTVEDTGSTPDDPQVFKSSYTVKIDGKNKADYVDKGVRCIVNCSMADRHTFSLFQRAVRGAFLRSANDR